MRFHFSIVSLKFSIIFFALFFTMICASVHEVNARVAGRSIETGNEQQQRLFLPYVAAGGPVNEAVIEPEAVPGEFLIMWKNPPEQQIHAAGMEQHIVLAGEDLFQALRTSQSSKPRIDLFKVNDLGAYGTTTVDILSEYRDNPDVLAVEPNYIYRSLGNDVASTRQNNRAPNDPEFDLQWGLGMSRALDAWDVTTGSATTVIAIIDSGVALDHPDLVNKLVAGYDFVEDDASPDDEYGHGTHVAGIAAAQTGNGIGVAGMCPDCKIMPLRALNERGGGSASNVLKAIYYAIEHDADVINLSLGAATLKSDILKKAVQDAWAAGVFVTCAAGNSGHAGNELIYPAAYDECVAVAATTQEDVRADGFSQYGTWVELAAPGQEIYSTYMTTSFDENGLIRENGYEYSEGTSMAAPHVAGLAGLLSAQGLSNNQIRQKLCDSADPIVGTGSEWQCGRINALAAVTGDAPPEPTATPTPNESLRPNPNATATPTPTPTPTAVPPEASELLPNGGFEDGSTAWFFSVPEIVTQKTSYNQASRHSAELGGENNSTDTIFQDVEVPINGTLVYNWGAIGEDANDVLRLEIELLDGSDAHFSIDHTDSFGVWRTRRIRLGTLAGKMIRIRFRALTDEQEPRFFYIDNVSMLGVER